MRQMMRATFAEKIAYDDLGGRRPGEARHGVDVQQQRTTESRSCATDRLGNSRMPGFVNRGDSVHDVSVGYLGAPNVSGSGQSARNEAQTGPYLLAVSWRQASRQVGQQGVYVGGASVEINPAARGARDMRDMAPHLRLFYQQIGVPVFQRTQLFSREPDHSGKACRIVLAGMGNRKDNRRRRL